MIRFHVTFLDGRDRDYTVSSVMGGVDALGRPLLMLFHGPEGPERILWVHEMETWEASVIHATGGPC